MTHESLARKLRILRAARGITLAEAEELTGVTRETLGALEHGQRGAYTSTLEKIARGYGVTLSALLSEVEEPEAELELAGSSPKASAPPETGQAPLEAKPGRTEASPERAPSEARELGSGQSLASPRRSPAFASLEVQEWLRSFGHTLEEEFLAWASDLDLDLDEGGFPRGIERATSELKRHRDGILDALRDPDVQADLFGRAQTEGLTGDDWTREVFRPSKAARKLANEIRQEYMRREVSLANYSVRLFVEGVTNDYLAYDRDREYLERRHRELLKLRTRALEEGSRRSQAHTKREMHHWLDEAYGGAA